MLNTRPGRAGSLARARAVAAALALLAAGHVQPWLHGSAYAQAAADVTVTDLRFAVGPLVYRVPRAEFRGTTLSRAELEAILSGSSSMPVAARIASLTAREVVIPEVVAELAAPGGGQVTTYRDVVFRDVSGGRVGSVVAGSGAFTAAGGASAGEGGFGRFSVEDVDLGLAVALFTEKAAAATAPLRRIYGAFSLENLTLRDKDRTTMRIARFGGRDFSAKPTPEGWLSIFETLGRNPDLNAAPIEERKRAYASLADLFDAFDLGLVEMAGIEFAGEGNDKGGRIGRIAFAGGAGGRPGEVQIEGVDVSADDGKVRIGGLAFSGVGMKPYLQALSELSTAKPAEMSVAALRKIVPLVGTLRMSGLDIDVPGKPGPTGTADRVRFALGGVDVAADKPLDGLPTDIRVAFRNVAFALPPAAEGDAARQLRGLGYERLDLSLSASLGWSAASQEIVLRDLTMSGAEMGSVAIRAVLGNVTKDIFNPDTAVAAVALLGATATSLELSVNNQGLAERVIGRDAREAGRSVEDLRRQYGSMAVIGIPALLGNSPSAKAIGQAVARFIAKPGRLEIRARAKSPGGLGFADLAGGPDPAALLNQVDVTATAE